MCWVAVVLLFGITGGFACLWLLCVIAGFWYSGFGLCLWLVVLEVLYFAVLCGLCGSFWCFLGASFLCVFGAVRILVWVGFVVVLAVAGCAHDTLGVCDCGCVGL